MTTVDDYLVLLKSSLKYYRETIHHSTDEFSLLSSKVFGFTTYDSDIDKLFVTKALEVCTAISDRTTFDYIRDKDNYRWYLLMINMDFFLDKLEWGTSIRGAWWDYSSDFYLESCGIFDEDGQQILKIEFDVKNQWPLFIKAMVEFVDKDKDRRELSDRMSH